ncbi:hypothetical protein DQ239_01250 [Blastococcus sp. TF02-09]|uniref:hypothetical protein n=1 Tax=Blastococcus sp. TF02-09 TaxID=2250576 RepID=UPI000DE947CD|nr:hypothetical protein [Blastococcus sp. TF02-9]RBY81269.1 hypothetical protein DQ239_01250 [Blastococcus sp. TF02-9]
MIAFSRVQATVYLAAMAVWVAGWLALVLSNVGEHASAPPGAVGVLLLSLFVASGSIGVIAWTTAHEGTARTTTPTLAGDWDELRLFLMSGLLCVLLLHGAGLPAAFRAVNANR